MNIKFLGAVKGVTGSCHLIRFKDKNILLDCGLFQGKDEELNSEEFEVNPSEIDYILLSHSHIDHSGRIPLLVKNGFKGSIYCSRPTFDLCGIMLIDSAYIQESEAEWKNRKAVRSGKKQVEPLYTQTDAENSLMYFKPIEYEQIIEIHEGLTVRYSDAGHILGSSIIEMWFNDGEDNVKLVFSGDLGMKEKPLLKDPSIIDKADYLIIEATYGNRLHEDVERRTKDLIDIILKTIGRGGNVIIPSFAVGRTQELIYELNKYYDCHMEEFCTNGNPIKNIPVYIDSPLATKATEIFKKNAHVFDKEARDYILSGNNPLEFENLHFTQSVEESRKLNLSLVPKIIISASGMCDAGRIKHHLKHNLWRKESSIVFVGYQAEGTLGRRILNGEKNLKIFGENIRVNAEIYNLEGFSGHADKNELLNWLGGFKEKPGTVFIVHGEEESKKDFAKEVEERLYLNCIVPEYNKVYNIKSSKTLEEISTELELNTNATTSYRVSDINSAGLMKNLEELSDIFDIAVNRTKTHIQDEQNKKEIEKIHNFIIDLEKEIISLTMMISE